MSSAPATLPADFDKWDAKAPDTLPADFNKWDSAPAAKTTQAPPPQRTWLDSAKDFAGELWNQVNPVAGVKGLAQAAAHPIDTANQLGSAQEDVANKAESAFKKGNYAEGVRHVLNYIIPVLGPQIDKAGDLADQGQYAKSAGMTAGIAANIAAPELIKNAALKLPVGQLPEQLYQGALKPSTTYSRREVGNMVKTGLENNIPVSSDGASKLGDLISDLNQKVSDQISAGAASGATVDRGQIASRLSQTASKFATQVNPEADLKAISSSGKEFLRSQPAAIPVDQAQALKVGTYRQLSDKAYGELSSATEEAQKALARGIKEELEKQFPEIQGLNAQEGKLINLNDALQRAVKRIDNRDVVSLGGKVATTGGAALGGAPGAAVSFILHHVITSPEVQTKLAIALNRAGKGAIPLPVATARVAGYANALGHTVASGDSEASNDSQAPQ